MVGRRHWHGIAWQAGNGPGEGMSFSFVWFVACMLHTHACTKSQPFFYVCMSLCPAVLLSPLGLSWSFFLKHSPFTHFAPFIPRLNLTLSHTIIYPNPALILVQYHHDIHIYWFPVALPAHIYKPGPYKNHAILDCPHLPGRPCHRAGQRKSHWYVLKRVCTHRPLCSPMTSVLSFLSLPPSLPPSLSSPSPPSDESRHHAVPRCAQPH